MIHHVSRPVDKSAWSYFYTKLCLFLRPGRSFVTDNRAPGVGGGKIDELARERPGFIQEWRERFKQVISVLFTDSLFRQCYLQLSKSTCSLYLFIWRLWAFPAILLLYGSTHVPLIFQQRTSGCFPNEIILHAVTSFRPRDGYTGGVAGAENSKLNSHAAGYITENTINFNIPQYFKQKLGQKWSKLP